MKLKEIYRLAVDVGISNDPRGKKDVKKTLERTKEKFEGLKKDEKEFFDKEKLKNPYADTRILCGDSDTEIEEILVGIDLEVGEILLAERLNEKGKNINLLLAHHPEGPALANLADVMKMQADIWHKQGVPINIGDALIDKRMREVFRHLMPANHNRAVDAAKLLGYAFMSIHTPADNLVTSYLQKIIDKEDPYTVREVVEILKKEPEYKEAAKEGHGPIIMAGDGEKRAGKVVVDMTGGTEGATGVIEKLAQAGVGTLVGMHMSDKMRKKAEANHLNVVIAGHIASDTIGLNILLDELAEKGIKKVVACSGFRRIKRS
jgi:putative NIF3 family GTP cyclohydrolase 1 type 2